MIDGMIAPLGGVKVIASRLLTVTETARRTWGERWFTRPWHPFRKTKQVTRPDPGLFRVPGVGYVGHPDTVARLKRLVDAQGKLADCLEDATR